MMIQEEKQLSIDEHLLACQIATQVDSIEQLKLKFAIVGIDFIAFKNGFKTYIDSKILPAYHQLISGDHAIEALIKSDTHFIVACAEYKAADDKVNDFQVVAFKNGKRCELTMSYELLKNAISGFRELDIETKIMTLIKHECEV